MKYTSQSWDPKDSEEEKSFRSFINNDPALSYFLEIGTLRKNAKFSKEEIYKEPKFLSFISPYFEPVYTAAVIHCFENKDTNMMSDIASNPILMSDTDKGKSFLALEQFLHLKLQKLVSANKQIETGGPIIPSELENYTGIIFICLLNYLPLEFQNIRSSFGNVMLNTVRLLINRDFTMALTLATNIRQLKCDPQTAQSADSLYQTITSATEKANAVAAIESERGGQMSTWGIIGIIVLIIRILIFFARR